MNLPEYLAAIEAAHRTYQGQVEQAAAELEKRLRGAADEFHGNLGERVDAPHREDRERL